MEVKQNVQKMSYREAKNSVQDKTNGETQPKSPQTDDGFIMMTSREVCSLKHTAAPGKQDIHKIKYIKALFMLVITEDCDN